MPLLPPLSALIPNRDGADLLRRTLPALLRELPPQQHEILVVDDASRDESVAMLSSEFPEVRVITLCENVGFGAACNLGFGQASHELVLLLNSDMEVTPGSIAVLMEHFAEPDVFAAGPEYRSARPEGAPPPQVPEPWVPALGVPAGGGLFRREVFLALGGFHPLYYPFYWEDMDLGWVAWRAGWRVLWDTRAHFLHLESATIRRLYSPGYVARVRARNKCLFGWKNFTSPWVRRRHTLAVVRNAVADLVRGRGAAALLGLWDALRMRREALKARPTAPAQRTDEEILAQFHVGLDFILKL